MLDWQKLVSQRLSRLALDPEQKHEVFAELAGHLEEVYESLRKEGLSEQPAIRRTLSQVKDWKNLQRKIHSARIKENAVTPRTSRFWLPSLMTLLISMSILPLLERLGIKPEFLSWRGARHETYMFPVYTVWLFMLPLVGALGAHLSRRAGGTRSTVVLSGIFPALAFSAILAVVIPFVGLLEYRLEPNAVPLFQRLTSIAPLGLLGIVTVWVLMPGVSLLIGVLAYEAAAKWRLKPAT